MKIWITSDHHFNHENIIKYCKRPFNSVEEMNEIMISKWNERVKKEDLVIHLGDFGFGNIDKLKEIRKRLNGLILLVMGNHDKNKILNQDFIVIKEPILIDNLIFTHYPLEKNEIPKGFKNIHGHIHQKDSLWGRNISVDKTNFYPLELEELKN